MCIRDSVTLSEATMVELRIDTQSALGQRAEVVRNGEVVALSLIHISEPHETVLDLVCRLLLEKKKTEKHKLE